MSFSDFQPEVSEWDPSQGDITRQHGLYPTPLDIDRIGLVIDVPHKDPEQKRRYNQRYAEEHREELIEYRRKWKRSQVAQCRILVENLKSQPCVDCGGYFHPVCMDFDHVRGVKSKNVSFMVANGYPQKRILEEIAKCDLVCANCHRLRTVETNGFYHVLV